MAAQPSSAARQLYGYDRSSNPAQGRTAPAPFSPATKGAPDIKPGSAGGPSAGKRFPESVRDDALEQNPSTCAFCRMGTDRPQVDRAIPR